MPFTLKKKLTAADNKQVFAKTIARETVLIKGIRLSAGVIACVMLGGCATRTLVAPPLPESRLGVASYAEMSYQPLEPDETETVRFDENTSPVARFADGLGVYAAFSIKPQQSASTLRIRTWLSSDWLSLATVVKPYVVFLDAEKHVISDVESFKSIDGSSFFLGGYKQGYFPVPQGSRYFVIYSAASESDRMVIRAQTGKLWGIPNAYHGKVDIKQETPPQ
ncbi:hypothetical protein GCM10027093_74530 [Paraburkholderia jirisanensis]